MDSQITVYVRNPRRVVAYVISAALVVLALLISQMKALSAERDSIDLQFSDASSAGSIAYNLAKRATDSVNMVTMANKAVPGDPAIDGLQNSRTALESAASRADKYTANQNLTIAFYALFDKLNTALKGDTQSLSVLSGLKADFDSCNAIISHNTFNADAAKFNKKLGGMPYSLFASLMGIQKLELFEAA